MPKDRQSTITCMFGIRFLTILWIIVGHSFAWIEVCDRAHEKWRKNLVILVQIPDPETPRSPLAFRFAFCSWLHLHFTSASKEGWRKTSYCIVRIFGIRLQAHASGNGTETHALLEIDAKSDRVKLEYAGMSLTSFLWFTTSVSILRSRRASWKTFKGIAALPRISRELRSLIFRF